MDDIPSVLKHWTITNPEKEVFVFFNENGRDSVLTARDVYLLSGRFASRLREWGFQPGDLINNAIPNSPERVVTDFGIIMAGCVGSNCQIMEKDVSDFWKAAQTYKSVGVILPKEDGDTAYSVLKGFLPPKLPVSQQCVDVSLPEAPWIKRIVLVDRHNSNSNTNNPQTSFLDSLRQSSEEIINQEISPASLAYVFATSGTTGYSKLSPRTHAQIMSTGRIFEKSAPTVRFSQRPLGWVGGYPFSFLASCTCIVIQDCFKGRAELSARRQWDILEKEKCTLAFMLPREMEFYMDYFRQHPPHYKLKAVITGGQPLSKKICEALGVLTEAFVVSYASTEMGAVTNALVTKRDQIQDFMCGLPLPGVSLRIVNDQMEDVEPGQQGIVLVKSPFGENNYYNYTPSQPICTDDGYFITRDRGWLNKDGVLFVCDRNDDAIFLGPILVYPGWPESVLSKIPGVSETVVFGISQEDGGNKLCACVALQTGCNLTKERLISLYNDSFTENKDEFFPTITYVEIVNSMPKLFNGKINRRKLREDIVKMIM